MLWLQLGRVKIVSFQNAGHREVQACCSGDGEFSLDILCGVEPHDANDDHRIGGGATAALSVAIIVKVKADRSQPGHKTGDSDARIILNDYGISRIDQIAASILKEHPEPRIRIIDDIGVKRDVTRRAERKGSRRPCVIIILKFQAVGIIGVEVIDEDTVTIALS